MIPNQIDQDIFYYKELTKELFEIIDKNKAINKKYQIELKKSNTNNKILFILLFISCGFNILFLLLYLIWYLK